MHIAFTQSTSYRHIHLIASTCLTRAHTHSHCCLSSSGITAAAHKKHHSRPQTHTNRAVMWPVRVPVTAQRWKKKKCVVGRCPMFLIGRTFQSRAESQ